MRAARDLTNLHMEQTNQPAKRLIAITIAPALIEAVDKMAARQFRSRSEVIRQAVLRELEKEGMCPSVAGAQNSEEAQHDNWKAI